MDQAQTDDRALADALTTHDDETCFAPPPAPMAMPKQTLSRGPLLRLAWPWRGVQDQR